MKRKSNAGQRRKNDGKNWECRVFGSVECRKYLFTTKLIHAKMISQTCSHSRAEVEKRKYNKKKKSILMFKRKTNVQLEKEKKNKGGFNSCHYFDTSRL